MKIYTKTGDKGETGIIGGSRVSKDDIRIEAYGTIDELNAVLGIVVNEISDEEILSLLKKVQNDLFTIGSDLASPVEGKNVPVVTIENIELLENSIDSFDFQLEKLKNFILPGGSKGSALLHFARTVCRRAERRVITLKKSSEINENIIIYLNRLSDLFFVLARYQNKISDIPDTIWKIDKQ